MAQVSSGVAASAQGKAQSPHSERAEEPGLPEVTASVWTKLGAGGRVVIPAEIRQQLGLKSGDGILLRVEDGELCLLTAHQAVKRAQDLARPFIRPGVSIVDELIAERRAEAARE